MKIRDILRDYGVHIVNSYEDRWESGQTPSLEEDRRRPKDIYVFPSERKIVMVKGPNSKHLPKVSTLYEE